MPSSAPSLAGRSADERHGLTSEPAPREGRRPRRFRRPRSTLHGGSALSLGIAMVWFSLLVLLPLAAILARAAEGGWSNYWAVVRDGQTWSAVTLTVTQAALVTVLNVVVGTIIAWVLVRDRFFGKPLLDLVIDVPFALPTIVAGLVLLSLYGPKSPIGVHWAFTEKAVFLAFAFVTLPFVVRTVQPVLEELDTDAEEAAASLGASQATILRRIVLPSLVPAIAAGAALSFARAISEYGSLVLLSGNKPYETEVASVRMLSFIENGSNASAATVASLMLAVALVVIVLLDVFAGRHQRREARRG